MARTDGQLHLPWAALVAAARREPVAAALSDLYDTLDREIASRRPTCWLSGRCCRFDTYGHRLYVTALEAAWLLDRLTPEQAERLAGTDPAALDGCVFQRDKLCGVHGIRPLGCRVYFCDPTATWQNDLYERFLGRLRELHDAQAIPYAYVEWRAALADWLDAGAG